MSPLLLLSLLFITASGSSFLPSHGNYLKLAALQTFNTHSTAEKFIESMNRAIASRDRAQVAALFADDFLYHGCKKILNKPHFIELLLSDATLTQTIIYKSSGRVRGRRTRLIWIDVNVFGYGSVSFDAHLMIVRQNGKYVLFRGHTTSCSKRARTVLMY